MTELRTAARLLHGELRRPDPLLWAMLLAVAIGVAALASVSGFAQRVQAGIDARAATLLGGSVRVAAQRDLRPVADSLPVALKPAAVLVELPTMAAVGERLRLVELKAVDAAYPLLGELRIADRGVQKAPAPGTVWAEPVLLAQLGVAVGQALDLGHASFTVAGVIEHEPDRVAGAFSIGPRVLLNLADLPATRLVSPQSRIRSRLLYAPPPGEAAQLIKALARALPDGLTVETADEGLDETRNLTRQAADFLRLVALAGVVLAAAAVVLAASNLTEKRLSAAAALKALGASRRLVLLAYAGLVATVALLGGLLGAAAGTGLERLLPVLLRGLVPTDLPPADAGLLPVALGLALLVALAVATPPLLRLGATPPAAVLRAPSEGEVERGFARTETAGLAIALLLCGAVYGWLGASAMRGLLGLGVLLGAALLFGVGARLLARAARRASVRGPFAWRYAAAAFGRAPAHTVLAVAALGFGVLAIVTPALVEADLLKQWQMRVPPDAPNRFLIDVQPDQRDAVAQVLAAGGAQGVDLRPMVRARLVAVDGQPPPPPKTERARRFLERENNLTWRAEPEPGNRLVAGRWWTADATEPQISLEQEWAAEVGVGLGDTLTFDIGGQPVTGTVTSLREVNWESLRSNFFVVFAPGALGEAPATYVTAYRIDPARADALLHALVQPFPNLTVIDLEAMTATLQDMVAQLSRATGFLAVFTLLAGLAVLLAAVLAERSRLLTEAAVLRTLGASRRQLGAVYNLRFALLGGAAALLGCGAAVAAGAFACLRYLDIPYRPNALALLATVLLATGLVTLTGRLGARRVLATPPAQSLRGE
ncbi:MAG: ABC transporter permease [Immundisolibacter sp.]|uniref:ABC transporter permease n=1 Tax=Immundisolibacter sp. TaxID=1934948 RepID=UPI003D119D15